MNLDTSTRQKWLPTGGRPALTGNRLLLRHLARREHLAGWCARCFSLWGQVVSQTHAQWFFQIIVAEGFFVCLLGLCVGFMCVICAIVNFFLCFDMSRLCISKRVKSVQRYEHCLVAVNSTHSTTSSSLAKSEQFFKKLKRNQGLYCHIQAYILSLLKRMAIITAPY